MGKGEGGDKIYKDYFKMYFHTSLNSQNVLRVPFSGLHGGACPTATIQRLLIFDDIGHPAGWYMVGRAPQPLFRGC